MFTILPDEEQLIVGSLPEELEGEEYTTCDLVEKKGLQCDEDYVTIWSDIF